MEKTRQWDRIKDVFDRALARPPEERSAFLGSACGADTELRAEVESLLDAFAQSDGLSQAAVPMEVLEEAQPLETIGPYRLIRKIGEGGMGQVWLAEQTEPLRRQVALKLIRAGLYDDALLRRFQAERQTLALMEHPAIAKVFDAGATPEGQPYLVMEYVPGEPITKYCDRRKLSISERLWLFARVCDGVQHAHQKAIIHGDLKPANILVVEVDGRAAPQIIDFGLARAIEPEAAEGGARSEGLMGTPGYMSPEQLGGGDVDTRTDVYALGVVLYELLTGQLPFETGQWRNEPPDAILRQVRMQPIVRPSERFAEHGAAAREAAERRGLPARQMSRLLAGDLDLIALKALEKERARRYGMPSELGGDVRHWLRHEPVEAHPASAVYQVRKYVRRHRLGTAMTLLLALLLPAFVALQAFELRRIARERDMEARIAAFMSGMFRVADPSEARGNQITAREILDKASTEIDTGLAGDPETQTRMMVVMGGVYENLGLYERAETLYREAAAIRERQLGPENSDTLKARASIGWTLYRRGRYHDSEALLREVLAVRMRRWGANNADTIAVMDSLGAVLNEQGHGAEAETLARRALAWRRSHLGDGNPDTVVAMNHLALDLQTEGRWAEAESLDRQQLALWQRAEGADSPHVLMAEDNLAIILYGERRYAEAEALDRQVLATKRRVLGPDHPETVRSMNTLTAVLTDEGKLGEAQAIGEQVLAIRTRVLGPYHPLTLSSMSNLGEILMRRGDYAGAGKILEQARATDVRVLGPNDPHTAMCTYNLGCLALREGRRDEALRYLREAVDHGLPRWVIAGMKTDPDLGPLRGDARFDALTAYATKNRPPGSGH